MEQFTLLFEEFLMKAITMTENFIAKDLSADIDYEDFTSNRERLLQVLDQISRQIDWNVVSTDMKTEMNRRIDYMKKLDEKLVVKLQEYQQEVKKDIEQTVRQKTNVKGYNLNDVK